MISQTLIWSWENNETILDTDFQAWLTFFIDSTKHFQIEKMLSLDMLVCLHFWKYHHQQYANSAPGFSFYVTPAIFRGFLYLAQVILSPLYSLPLLASAL